MNSPYCGRFAPSPTGPLHFGSLVAAVASYADARHHGGRWLLRIEDLDTPRSVPGASEDIRATLAACGMHADGEIIAQSARSEVYAAALAQLRARGLAYACACSRREIADSALRGIEGAVYPGTCRTGIGDRPARAWRVNTHGVQIAFEDAVQGRVVQDLERDIGDFVLYRADHIHAYQLAVVVDDAAQGITDVVRGADLLDSTPRQIYLQQRLKLPTPRYLHVPVAVNAAGEKLSKQTQAPAIDRAQTLPALTAALQRLGQQPPAAGSIAELWAWVIPHWRRENIPRQRALPMTTA